MRSYKNGAILSRRDLCKLGIGFAGAAAIGKALIPGAARAGSLPPTPIKFTPFTRALPMPATHQPVAAFPTDARFSTSATPNYYVVHMKTGLAEIIPDVQTGIWGYNGQYPGPSFRGTFGTPDVVRQINDLDVETSVHLHSGHNPSESDGLPFQDLLIRPGGFKDYSYPNQPVGFSTGEPDPNDNATTGWYHDHATDITGPNVYHGLAGFYLFTDELEQRLIASNMLPSADYDVPLVLQDRRFNADGSLFYNPFEHDGFLGDVFVANGKAQPYFKVQRRKYRFRILNGANARMWFLRLSNDAPFLRLATDGWMLPAAITQNRIFLGMAERADVVIDFRNAPDTVFLENIAVQDSGRGPEGSSQKPDSVIPGTPLVKFIVEGPPVANDARVTVGTLLRPSTPIRANEIVATRRFEFNRSEGAWQVNGRFFDENRVDATIRKGTAERWILKNGSGGWWHPIHLHLECHQVQRFNGAPPPPHNAFKKDTTLLGPGDEAEVFMRFRDFSSRFVAHCHNIEHEDMRMMFRWDVV
jgi:FtsP/CotA-like multicopper oxidase with cupredoxin domain